jgi:hypothetical protein
MMEQGNTILGLKHAVAEAKEQELQTKRLLTDLEGQQKAFADQVQEFDTAVSALYASTAHARGKADAERAAMYGKVLALYDDTHTAEMSAAKLTEALNEGQQHRGRVTGRGGGNTDAVRHVLGTVNNQLAALHGIREDAAKLEQLLNSAALQSQMA